MGDCGSVPSLRGTGKALAWFFGPGFGLTLYLLFCSVEILAYHSLKAEPTAGA